MYVAALVALFCLHRSWRKSLILPSAIIALIVLNPVFYALWNTVIERSYWRTIWMIPIIVIIASVPAVLEGKKRGQALTVLLFTAAIIASGFPVYSYRDTAFKLAANPDKLPDQVVSVANALLALEENPRVVADYSLSVYLRQYSGKIKSLYGRNVDMEVTEPILARAVFDNLRLDDGDMNLVRTKMVENGYRWLIAENTDPQRSRKILEAGFVLNQQVTDNYGIYEALQK